MIAGQPSFANSDRLVPDVQVVRSFLLVPVCLPTCMLCGMLDFAKTPLSTLLVDWNFFLCFVSKPG